MCVYVCVCVCMRVHMDTHTSPYSSGSFFLDYFSAGECVNVLHSGLQNDITAPPLYRGRPVLSGDAFQQLLKTVQSGLEGRDMNNIVGASTTLAELLK